MHDDWTQRLAVLAMDAASLEQRLDRPDEAARLVRAMRVGLVALSEDVHAPSRQLHPAILDDLGLADALRSECAAVSERERIAVRYRPAEVPASLPRDLALCLYRVAQEALRNVVEHARADEAWVTLGVTGGEVVLCVEDRGAGFDAAGPHPGGAGPVEHEGARPADRRRPVGRVGAGRGTRVTARVRLPRGWVMSRPRVLLADDHPILAAGVRGLLEPEFELVGVVTDGQALVAAAGTLRPDVIVADVTMPGLNGIEAAAAPPGGGHLQGRLPDDAPRRRLRAAGDGSRGLGLRAEALGPRRTGHGGPGGDRREDLRHPGDRRGAASARTARTASDARARPAA